jgi:hypothetical protein
MLVPLLALSLVQGAISQPSRLDRLKAEPPPGPAAATLVVLDCQVAARALTDCKAVNDVLDSGMVAEALRMAAGIVAPQALVDRGPGRVTVKINVSR